MTVVCIWNTTCCLVTPPKLQWKRNRLFGLLQFQSIIRYLVRNMSKSNGTLHALTINEIYLTISKWDVMDFYRDIFIPIHSVIYLISICHVRASGQGILRNCWIQAFLLSLRKAQSSDSLMLEALISPSSPAAISVAVLWNRV